jgi:hypothetical protein
MIALALPAPMAGFVKLFRIAGAVAPNSHWYCGSNGPRGGVEPAVQAMESAVPQRQGVACKVDAHFDEKMSFNVSKQTAVSLGEPETPMAAPQAAGAVPVTSSQRPPPMLASKQPLSFAQARQSAPSEPMQASVLLVSQPAGAAHVPDELHV